MNETKVPSSDADAIYAGFNKHCDASFCEGCIYNHCDYLNLCIVQYTHDILTGKMKLTDSFRKDEPKPEPKLPAWCKIGQWVTESRPEHSFGYIDGIFSDRRIGVAWWKHPKDGFTGLSRPTDTVKPIRFRPYTFEEAKTLLGKVMEWSYMAGTFCASLVCEVEENGAGVEINGTKFCDLQRWVATIDGIPIGVPEIDEEALKGCQE